MRMQLTILAATMALTACGGPMAIKEKQQASEADLVKNFIETKFKEGQRNGGGGYECAINISWPSNEIQSVGGGSVLDKLRANGTRPGPARDSLESLGLGRPDNACTLGYAVSAAPAVRKYATTIWVKEENGQRFGRSLSPTEAETVFEALKECKSWDDMLAEKQQIFQAQNYANRGRGSLTMVEAMRTTADVAQAVRPIVPHILVCSGLKRDAARYRADVSQWLNENKERISTARGVDVFR